MKHQIPWNLLLEHLKDKSAEIDPQFREWLQDKENQQFWDELQVLYSINGNVPEYYQPEQEKGWKNIEHRILKSVHRTNNIHYLLRIAASILLFMLGAAGYWILDQQTRKDIYSEVVSPYGHKTMVLLPDSSVVWLNGNSRIRYKTDFSRERVVELEGEALFDIQKRPSNLFSVQSGSIRLEVYGTKFNFRSFTDENETEIALLNGSVGIFRDDLHLKTMKPGEVVTYFPDENKILTTARKIDQIISWQSDELVINNKILKEVFGYLERWYGVSINYTEEDLQHGQKLSFKVKTESLRELLSIINRITPIKYSIDGKNVRITKL
jgi:ferric-dicitrate binding protein FerR (iron transport regulator)